MQIFKDLPSWITHRRAFDPTLSIGFVPTMGNLHVGHTSLFQKSKKDNDITVTSLFVNPTQFNQKEDYETYPRTLDEDLGILESLNLDYCILPSEESMYPDKYRYQVEENDLSRVMEGMQRPGHFTGVLTIVLKLLNLVRPDNIYFGEKDYQQYTLIKGMAKAYFLQTEVIACPTIREPSGLAFSSRNNRLKPKERLIAERYAEIFHQKDKTCAEIQSQLENEGITVEYIEEHEGRRFIVVVISGVRLIDNYMQVSAN